LPERAQGRGVVRGLPGRDGARLGGGGIAGADRAADVPQSMPLRDRVPPRAGGGGGVTDQQRLVSIITGTIPSRFDLLVEAMANLRSQTYANVEHCIAVEADNRAVVHETVARIKAEAERLGCADSTHVVGLGRWWSRYLAASMSTVPFQVAQWMASGPLCLWWADDERAIVDDHIEALVDLLETEDADFVYPYVRLVPAPGIPMPAHIIGSDPPYLGQITHALFRSDLLDYRGFTPGIGSATDWDQIEAWMQAGARWAMLPRVTFEHRLDKLGEGDDFRSERRPLRGHRERVGT
jgi:hypothetical protein